MITGSHVSWLCFALVLSGGACCALAAQGPGTRPMGKLMWCPDTRSDEADYYVAFRGRFDMPAEGEIELRVLGASWYVVWLDGAYVTEGPPRFPAGFPEYQSRRVRVSGGKHVLAVQVHHIGLATRMLENIEPFLFCQVVAEQKELAVRWSCTRLGGYGSKVRRINAQLGWIEWCDTRQVPASWQSPGFDDGAWKAPAEVERKLGRLQPASIAEVRSFVHPLKATAQGPLAETFGYEQDNIAARFFLRDQACEKLPAQGVWRRYDLGRVRLGRPRLVMDLPAGAVVEFAYSEALSRGRVAAWITLSASDSCNLDHYVARGGEQEFFPLTPKGGRFVEVHVLARPEQVRFVKEEYVERCYYDRPEGSFACGDELLERIWMTGIETHRGCAEDALIDNPTRERGQWAGDVVAVGMDIAAAGYSDLRLCRRGLVQCAQCAREDGLVSGMCPGGGTYLSTYAAQWISACVHYWELTGDRALLEELFTAAERNVAAFERFMTADGLRDDLGWGFVDWGYVRNAGPVDMAVNLHYVAGLRDMVRWCRALGRNERADTYQGLEKRLAGIVQRHYQSQTREGQADWGRIGYHRAVLGLRLGFFRGDEQRRCIEFIKSHMLSCFPNNTAAPRLSDPGANNSRLITPYFAHYAMPALIEHGQMDFVLGQYRKCWGWALEDGRTTWVEVFDTRWSHSHQWAGCPTWQLSRYVLGLHPRFDLGENHFVLNLQAGSLPGASGGVPLPGQGSQVRVEWKREADGVHYSLQTERAIWVHLPASVAGAGEKPVKVEGRYDAVLR